MGIGHESSGAITSSVRRNGKAGRCQGRPDLASRPIAIRVCDEQRGALRRWTVRAREVCRTRW